MLIENHKKRKEIHAGRAPSKFEYERDGVRECSIGFSSCDRKQSESARVMDFHSSLCILHNDVISLLFYTHQIKSTVWKKKSFVKCAGKKTLVCKLLKLCLYIDFLLILFKLVFLMKNERERENVRLKKEVLRLFKSLK